FMVSAAAVSSPTVGRAACAFAGACLLAARERRVGSLQPPRLERRPSPPSDGTAPATTRGSTSAQTIDQQLVIPDRAFVTVRPGFEDLVRLFRGSNRFLFVPELCLDLCFAGIHEIRIGTLGDAFIDPLRCLLHV